MTAEQQAYERGLEDAARAIEAMKNGHTLDVLTAKLLPDEDGPWFLKSDCARTVRHLATKSTPAPKRRGEHAMAECASCGRGAECWSDGLVWTCVECVPCPDCQGGGR